MSRQPRILQRSFAGGEMSPQMYGRPDDSRLINGAGLCLNMICRPTGSVFRRPGTRFVAKVKDGANYKSYVYPFTFSPTQSVVVEGSRAVVNGVEMGHFRFHVDGGTLLYSQPDDWLESQLVTISSGLMTTASSHGLQAGDPVVMTMNPGGSSPTCAFANVATTGDQTVTITGTHGLTSFFGQQIMFEDQLGPGTLPANVEPYRIYWLTSRTGSVITFSETYNGPNVKGSGAASTGTIYMAAMPRWFPDARANRVYYVSTAGLTSNTYRLAETKCAALAGDYITGSNDGCGNRRGRYAYRRGDVVYSSTGGTPGNFYCLREPWCNAPTPDDWIYCYLLDHLPDDTSDRKFWTQLPGDFTAGVTVTPSTDTIDFGAAHGLTNNDPLILSGSTPPGGTSFGTVYYAIVTGTNTIQISETPSGPVLDITSAGTSVDVLTNPIYEVPHFYSEDELATMSTAQSNDILTLSSQDHPVSELRRISASRWEHHPVRFEAKTAVPEKPYVVDVYTGESILGGPSTSANRIETVSYHTFVAGNPVYVRGAFGTVPFSDDFYTVDQVFGSPPNQISLKRYNGGAAVTFAVSSGWAVEIMFCESITDITNYYKITAVDNQGEESEPSEELDVLNNLLVAGSHTDIGWSPVPNATRYRIYKKQNGLFGFIGETEDLQFRDDNIGPDLSVSPPIVDTSMRQIGFITWDQTNDVVLWPGHSLQERDPVVFHGNGVMPDDILEGATYYAINIGDGAFQLASDSEGTTAQTVSSGTPTGEVWAEGGSFPGSVTYFEGRRMFAGSRGRPQDVWATASGTESDLSYSIPIVDSDRIYFRIASREGSAVRHLVPLSQLVLLSNTIEYRLTPLNSDAITPSTISVRPQSYIGADYPQPAVINNNVVFAAARGGHIRELGYSQDVLGYLTGDLSLRAQHLFDGFSVTDIAYQKAPVPMVWCVSSSGKLLSLTYIPEEQIGAWSQHVTDGTWESIASIPEGVEDAVYCVVQRDGERFIERFADQFTGGVAVLEDAIYVDASVTYDGAATTTINVPHLAGRAVTYLADGVTGTGTVSAGGVLTLATAASKVHIGLPSVARLETVPLYAQVDQAFGSAMTKNILKAHVRVYQSGAFSAGPVGGRLVPSRSPAAGLLQTKLQEVKLPGSWNDEGRIAIEQSDALPLTVLGITMEVAFGN